MNACNKNQTRSAWDQILKNASEICPAMTPGQLLQIVSLAPKGPRTFPLLKQNISPFRISDTIAFLRLSHKFQISECISVMKHLKSLIHSSHSELTDHVVVELINTLVGIRARASTQRAPAYRKRFKPAVSDPYIDQVDALINDCLKTVSDWIEGPRFSCRIPSNAVSIVKGFSQFNFKRKQSIKILCAVIDLENISTTEAVQLLNSLTLLRFVSIHLAERIAQKVLKSNEATFDDLYNLLTSLNELPSVTCLGSVVEKLTQAVTCSSLSIAQLVDIGMILNDKQPSERFWSVWDKKTVHQIDEGLDTQILLKLCSIVSLNEEIEFKLGDILTRRLSELTESDLRFVLKLKPLSRDQFSAILTQLCRVHDCNDLIKCTKLMTEDKLIKDLCEVHSVSAESIVLLNRQRYSATCINGKT